MGKKYLLNAYLLSAMALLLARKLITLYAPLNEKGDVMVVFAVVLSVLFGYLATLLFEKIKNLLKSRE
ncbi:MAG: hypothetical protein IJY92_00575 [Alphaproteobacteria bacterium]|nr:hypothetical protein [Alphaproteobacteria bacterium]